jgi:hypothetical protein
MLPLNGGTLAFSGGVGQLFSISNNMTGTIYSVNDISGMPSIQVLDTGNIQMAQYSGNVLVGGTTSDGVSKLQVTGSANVSSLRIAGYGQVINSSGNITVPNSTSAITLASGYTIGMGDWGLRNTTPYGWIEFGPANSGYAHIYSNGLPFYFNNTVYSPNNIYTPYHYDFNNTSYYVIPSGTSNLNALSVSNTISFTHQGTLISHTGMTDAFGYNSSYGTYIGSPVGATYYVYGNGSFNNNGTITRLAIYGYNYASTLYASTYYDGNNTGYYLVPSGTSNLNALNIASSGSNVFFWSGNNTSAGNFNSFSGQQTSDLYNVGGWTNFPSGAYGYGQLITNQSSNAMYQMWAAEQASNGYGLFYRTGWAGTWHAWQRILDTDNAAYAWAMNQYVGTSNSVTFAGLTITGNEQINGTYYDGSNTGYYVKPSSGSVLNTVRLMGNYLYINPTSPFYMICDQGPGSFYIGDDDTVYLATSASTRTPLIYDYSNTGYYVKPSGTSVMSAIAMPSRGTSASSLYIGNQNVSTSDRLTINFHTDSDMSYYIGKPAGGWTQPLYIYFYTGQRYYAHQSYDFGMSFWNLSSGTRLAAFGQGGDVIYLNVNTYLGGTLYDNSNTGYYVKPSSTSRVLLLESDQGYQYTAYNSGRNRIWSFANADGYGMAYFQGSGGYNGNTDMIGMHFGSATVAGCQFTFVQNGTFIASNNITAYSDIRLKANIEVITNALYKVQQIRGVTYTRNDTEDKDTKYVGVIAQEVLKVLPEAVLGTEDTQYSVAYGNMVGLLIEAIKEQQAQIDELKSIINSKP